MNGEIPVWAVLDKSTPKPRAHDVLYFDLDGDGDLTDANERFVGKITTNEKSLRSFTVGRFAVPGTDDVHEDFTLSSRQRSVSFKMKWRGEKTTMGAYGPDTDTYGNFTSSIDDSDSGLAWQVLAGVRAPLTDSVDVGLGNMCRRRLPRLGSPRIGFSRRVLVACPRWPFVWRS